MTDTWRCPVCQRLYASKPESCLQCSRTREWAKVRNICRIGCATSLQGIREAMREPVRAAKGLDDTTLVAELIEAATRRRKELEATPVAEGIR